jgi:hypothetical protein
LADKEPDDIDWAVDDVLDGDQDEDEDDGLPEIGGAYIDGDEARLRKKSDPSSFGRGGNLGAAAAIGPFGSSAMYVDAVGKDIEDDEDDEEDDEDDEDDDKVCCSRDMADVCGGGGAASRPDRARKPRLCRGLVQ